MEYPRERLPQRHYRSVVPRPTNTTRSVSRSAHSLSAGSPVCVWQDGYVLILLPQACRPPPLPKYSLGRE